MAHIPLEAARPPSKSARGPGVSDSLQVLPGKLLAAQPPWFLFGFVELMRAQAEEEASQKVEAGVAILLISTRFLEWKRWKKILRPE